MRKGASAASPPRDAGGGAGLATGLARGTSLNLFGSLCSKGVTFVIALVLIAMLGKVGMGRYAQAFAVLTILELVALLPFGSGLVRMVAVHKDEAEAVRGTIRAGVAMTVLTSAILAGALFLGAPWLAHRGLQDGGLVEPLRLVALTLVPLSVADALLHATMGFQRMRANAVVKLVAEPVVRLVAITVLVAAGLGIAGAVIGLLVSCSVQAVLAWVALRRLAGRWYAGPARHELGPLCAFSLPTGLGGFMSMGLAWADSLIIGAFRSSGDVGVYQIATRIVMLATFVIPAVSMAFSPRIAMLTHRGDHESLYKAYMGVTTWTLRLSMPAFVVLALFANDLLRVFGPEFAAASGVTLVLLVGAICNAWTGPGMQMLTMSGHPVWGAVNNGLGLTLNIALNLVLIPRFGIVGAAWAWTAALIAMNLTRLVQVRHLLGMWPFHSSQRAVLLIALLSGAVAALVTQWVAWPGRLVLGPLVVVATYVPLTVFRLEGKDWALLREAARFRRPPADRHYT
ncbi:MAG TPA: flippase [Nocardioidaceae bacterium]|nr:flippase [Nocardioidaceae bacterium]